MSNPLGDCSTSPPISQGMSFQRAFFFSPAQNSFHLEAYSNADWGSSLDTRKSLTGYCIFMGSALISWKTEKQTTISRSSTEAEYTSRGSTVCELQWISYILNDLHIPLLTPIPLWCDNRVALHITANPVFHERTNIWPLIVTS